jgi:hypothetical protein
MGGHPAWPPENRLRGRLIKRDSRCGHESRYMVDFLSARRIVTVDRESAAVLISYRIKRDLFADSYFAAKAPVVAS